MKPDAQPQATARALCVEEACGAGVDSSGTGREVQDGVIQKIILGRLPFGNASAPALLQRTMDTILQGAGGGGGGLVI